MKTIHGSPRLGKMLYKLRLNKRTFWNALKVTTGQMVEHGIFPGRCICKDPLQRFTSDPHPAPRGN